MGYYYLYVYIYVQILINKLNQYSPETPRTHTPLSQSLALVVSGGLQVSLQPFLLRLQLLCVVGLQALAGADVLQLLQQLLLLVNEDEAISFRVQQPRPGLAVQFGNLDLDGGDPERGRGRERGSA